MTARDPNIEQEVHDMVRRIVDGIFGEDTGSPVVAEFDEVSDGPDPVRTVAIGGDHGGYALKERLGFKLKEQGFSIIDCGTDSTDAVDYPDIAASVARTVRSGEADAGVIIDGAGIGSAMAANKIPGIRAAQCYDISTARNAREHNHANVITLGAGLIGDALAWQITQEFLATPFGGGRHARRVDKINDLDSTPSER